MTRKDLLKGKRVLIVDDEPEVLDTLEELLDMCDVTKAYDFETAKSKLETEDFDLAILDIMGVNGYKLLELARKKNVVAVMLTAHAFSVKDTVNSFKGGAAFYVPKEKISEICTYLSDVLEASEEGRKPWWRWFERLASYYEKRFGADWRDSDEEFWKKFGAD